MYLSTGMDISYYIPEPRTMSFDSVLFKIAGPQAYVFSYIHVSECRNGNFLMYVCTKNNVSLILCYSKCHVDQLMFPLIVMHLSAGMHIFGTVPMTYKFF